MSSPIQTHIAVLGAGITGLQTALTLLTASHPSPYKISIIATHIPGDLSPTYTSPWAGGHWRSHATITPEDELLRKWDRRTYAYWRELLENGDGMKGFEMESLEERTKRVGLGFKGSLNFWGSETGETTAGDGSGLWWSKDTVKNFKVLSKNELKGYAKGGELVFGVQYESICINIPQYLTYLLSRIAFLGATIIKSTIDTSSRLPGAVKHIGSILATNGLPYPDVVINTTGLSARHLVSESEAEKLFPIRGQTILVRGEAKLARTVTNFGLEDEVIYVIPRPGSGTTILGGCKQVGSFDEKEDEELNGRILERVRRWEVAEELKREDGEFEVVSTQVGFRPGRRGGPRVEVEGGDGDKKGKVDDCWVVHCYGHAGAGYQNSVGCAEEVCAIVRELVGKL